MIDPITEHILREDLLIEELSGTLNRITSQLKIKPTLKKFTTGLKSKSGAKVEDSLSHVPDIGISNLKLAIARKVKTFTKNYNKAKLKMKAKGAESKEALAIAAALTASAREKDVDEIIKDIGEKRFHPRNTLMLLISLVFLMRAAGAEMLARQDGMTYDYESTYGLFIVAAFLVLIKSIINVAKKQDAKWFFAIV